MRSIDPRPSGDNSQTGENTAAAAASLYALPPSHAELGGSLGVAPPPPVEAPRRPYGHLALDHRTLEAWADLAEQMQHQHGFLWEWWVTITFRNLVHPEAAYKLFRFWTHTRINRPLYGSRYWKRGEGAPYFLGIERCPSRPTVHIHALLGGGVRALRRMSEVDWLFLHAGISRILPYDPDRGAKFYVAKYAAKEGNAEGEIEPWVPRTRSTELLPGVDGAHCARPPAITHLQRGEIA